MKKNKLLLQGLYVSMLVPLVIIYILPILQMMLLGDDKPYYKNTTLFLTQIAVFVIAVMLISSSYIFFQKGFQIVTCYMIGILVSFTGIVFPLNDNIKFIERSLLSNIVIVGYSICTILHEIRALEKRKL